VTKQAEPAYRTAHAETKSPICPECGYDFTGEHSENVLAHIEGYHPGFNIHDVSNDALDRKNELLAIAKELG